MIPFVGYVGRVALTQAGRQVGREFGREVLERVMGGETLGQILTRDEMKILARTFGKATATLMLNQGKDLRTRCGRKRGASSLHALFSQQHFHNNNNNKKKKKKKKKKNKNKNKNKNKWGHSRP